MISNFFKNLFFVSTFSLQPAFSVCQNFDLTIVGPARWQDGLGRISIGLADTLKDELAINYIESCFWDSTDMPKPILSLFSTAYTQAGTVALLTSPLSGRIRTHAHDIPEEAALKIAYSMFESDAIHPKWVKILNATFDLVVVPDSYCEEVYKNSGVKIPIFTLPHGIYLESYLNAQKESITKRSTFTFGLTGSFCARKNQELLLEAFCQEFKNDPQIFLKMHGRSGSSQEYVLKLKEMQQALNAHNVEIIVTDLSDNDCLAFFQSLDCYVLLSRGEGFSLTPREALALGIPCILSNNTAHRTICQTEYVLPVPSEKKVLADYGGIFKVGDVGSNFDCEIDDVRKALRTMYNNYPYYKQKARDSKKWVESYLWKNLRPKYLNLIKPKKVLLGSQNEVTDDYFMTSSLSLYHKYKSLFTNHESTTASDR